MGKFKVGDRVRVLPERYEGHPAGSKYNLPRGVGEVVSYVCDQSMTVRWGWTVSPPVNPDSFELVVDSPVRTVTRTEIVPGVYGRIGVGLADSKSVLLGITGHMNAYAQFSRPELTAAIATLTTIRDALEEVA